MPDPASESIAFDPFAISPDPRVYVARAASEAARRDLLRSVRNPEKTTALIGPPGLGKTLLLLRTARELPAELRVVYLPYAALLPEDFCAWALRALDAPVSDAPIGDFDAFMVRLRAQGRALLMLIDDAGALPTATARWIGEQIRNAGGALRIALAAPNDASGNRALAAIGSNFDVVHLSEPMTELETQDYIEQRLALARAPASIRAHFDARTIRTLHRIAAGIPRRVNAAAAELLQQAPDAGVEDASSPTLAGAGIGGTRGEASAAPPRPAATTEPVGVPRAAPLADATAAREAAGERSEERRVRHRRAEPVGVAVRVGLGSAPASKGRRSEDAVAPSAEDGEAREGAPLELDAAEQDESDREPEPDLDATAPLASATRSGPAAAPLRVEPPPSRRSVALTLLFVAGATVAIPLIRSILDEQSPVARSEPAPNARERALPASGEQPRAASDAAARSAERAAGSAAARAAQPLSAAQPGTAPEPDAAQPLGAAKPRRAAEPREGVGPFAVSINATPWANIEVDGVDLGATPLANVPLVAGEHVFRARMPDGRVIERRLAIDAEQRFVSFE